MKNVMKRQLSGLIVAGAFALAAAAAQAAPAAEPTTLENLQAAFSGESNAKVRYEAFAIKADAEGYAGAASLFRAASRSEAVHAARHAKVIASMGAAPKADIQAPEIKSTKENLLAAQSGEDYERLTMYPRFIKKAKADKNAAAVDSFGDAKAVETAHSKLYGAALAKLEDWKVKRKFLVCQNCGDATQNQKIKRCPVCSKPRSEFVDVE